MTTITVGSVYPPKPGKKSGTIKTPGGDFYGFYPDKFPLESWTVGATYECEVEGREFQGKMYYTVKKRSGGGQNGATRASTGSGGASALPDRFWLNFVSNVVGQAIAAKTITDPLDIKAWASAAKLAMTEIDAGNVREPGEDFE